MNKNIELIEVADVFVGVKITNEDLQNADNVKEFKILNLNAIEDSQITNNFDDTINFDEADKGEKVKVGFNRKIKNSIVKKQDLIIPLKRSNHQTLMVNWTSNEPLNYIYNTETLVIRVEKELVLPKFMYYWLNNAMVLNYINSNASKNPNRISCSLINKLKIEVPPMEEQQALVDELDDIIQRRLLVEEKISNYAKYYKK